MLMHISWKRNALPVMSFVRNVKLSTTNLVIVLGDSPGHSILYLIPSGGDISARKADVDTVATHLHHLGVEIFSFPISGWECLPRRSASYNF
jgi:hypothetical protein